MYAALGQASIDATRLAEADKALEENLIPWVSSMDGFVSGTWTRSPDGTQGRSLILFDTEENAQAAAEAGRAQGPPPGAPISITSVDVFEVVGQA